MFKRFSPVNLRITHLLLPCHVTDVYRSFVEFWQQDHSGRVCSLCMGTNWQVFGPMLKMLYIIREFKWGICQKCTHSIVHKLKVHKRNLIDLINFLLFIFLKNFVYYWTKFWWWRLWLVLPSSRLIGHSALELWRSHSSTSSGHKLSVRSVVVWYSYHCWLQGISHSHSELQVWPTKTKNISYMNFRSCLHN